jgi:hypothetical protein
VVAQAASITFFDTAEVYGPFTSGKALAIPARDGYGDGGWPTWR